MDPQEKPADPRLAARRLRRIEAEFVRPYRRVILLCLLGMLAQSVLLLPLPLLQGRVLDRLVALSEVSGRIPPAQSAAAVRLIVLVVGASIGCHLVRMALAWLVGSRMARVSQVVVVTLTDALHRKLHRLPMSFFDRQQTGRLMARLTSDVGSVLIFLGSGFLQLVTDLILAMAIGGLLLWVQWRLALVTFVVLPVYALNHRLFAERIRHLSREVRSQLSTVYALLGERVSAVRVVRSFAKEEAEIEALDRQIDVHRSLALANMKTGGRQTALATLISGLGTVLVISYGVTLVGRGRLTVGELLAFYAFIAQLYNPIVRLTQFYATATATLVAVERMYEIFDEPEAVRDKPGARALKSPNGRLVYRDVTFAYDPAGPIVLDRIDLAIEPGMTVGVLGPSGSGKSTLLALAPRIYDVPGGSGAVLVDGRDVRDYRLADLRRSVALVSQRALLFDGTIRSNLLYAAPNADDRAIARALEAADFASTVASLPFGLDTPVGERGATLSGGQRQRLALARALLADPAVLLLDDCTSALDAETEARVQAALADWSPRRTCVVVSHKLSSVRDADRIVVLDCGRVVEQGSHADLLDLGGRYAEACDRQAVAAAFA
jgi:ABC-type multidrug transport system fused ATPase/permease subunit